MKEYKILTKEQQRQIRGGWIINNGDGTCSRVTQCGQSLCFGPIFRCDIEEDAPE